MTSQEEGGYQEIDTTSLYLKELAGGAELLTKEEEADLGRRIQKGDLIAKRRMIESNLRLVVRVVRQNRLFARGIDFIDAISEGNMGLIRAVEKFNPDYGFRFSTYAVYWIKQSVERGIYNHSTTIRIPVHVRKELNAYYSAVRELCKKLSYEPSQHEIADFLDRPVEDLRKMLGLAQNKYSSMDESQNEGKHTLGELIPDESVEHHEEKELGDKVILLLGELKPQEKQVLCMRFGLCGYSDLTLEETGNQVGLTRERVRQIQVTALKKLSNIALEKNIDASMLRIAS